MSKTDEIINLLVQNKLITQSALDEIMKQPAFSANPEAALVENGLVDIEEFTKLKAKVYNLEYRNLADIKIPKPALEAISFEAAQNYKIICFEIAEGKMRVGLVDPENYKAVEVMDFLAKKQGLKLEYYLISALSFDHSLEQYKTAGEEAPDLNIENSSISYKSLSEEVSGALKFKAEEDALTLSKKRVGETKVEEIVKAAPVSRIVSVIIRHAVDGRASDIHIEPMQKESRVRYRIDGILHTSLVLPKSIHGAIVGRIKVLADLKLDETRMPQDGRIRVTVNNKEVDLRISILPLLDDEKIVMRVLDVAQGAPTLEEMGFMGPGLKVILDNVKRSSGLFLVAGPTGSGKSTTLFSILTSLNKEGINISTLEDPVEYYVKGVNQSQVKPEIGYTFASGLRSLLRQDPNVIMVGEIRDNETAELGIHASLTGHFVLSTLHTSDALGAIPRLIDMKVEPFLLGSTLNVVVAQRLARKICGHCKEEQKLPDDLVVAVKKELAITPTAVIEQILPGYDFKKIKFYKGKGCAYCGSTGYMGRIALAEVLDVNDKIKQIIMDNKKNLTVDELIKDQNFITIKQDSLVKVLLGLTTMEEILRTVSI